MKNGKLIKIVAPFAFTILLVTACGKPAESAPAVEPSITTSAVSDIAYGSAMGGGNVMGDGGATIISRGICYGTAENPDISGMKIPAQGTTGSFNSLLSSLSDNTTYYVRAFATNTVGTGYGSQVSFTTCRIYYIDGSGADSAGRDGSSGQEWASLSYASGRVAIAGSLIHVNAGTYTETAKSALKEGVSIEGEGDTSIILSHVPTTGTFETIILTSPSEGTNGNQSISNLVFDGDNRTAYAAIRVYCRSNVSVHDCKFLNFERMGVQFNGSFSGVLPTAWSTGNRFFNNTMSNCSAYYGGIHQGCLEASGQDGMLIYGNTIHYGERPVGENGFGIKCVNGFIRNVKIFGNELYGEQTGTVSYCFSVELWSCRGGVEVHDNTMTGTIDIAGISSTKEASDPYSVYVHHNVIGWASLGTNEYTRGIEIECGGAGVADVIVEKNHVKNMANGVFFASSFSGAEFRDIGIRYNIFENIGEITGGSNSKGWGIRWSMGYNDLVIRNIAIWNNVFTAHTGGMTSMWGIGLPNCGSATNISVRNNIVTDFGYAPVYGSGTGTETVDILSIENNIFYGNGNSNSPRYSGILPTNNITQNNRTDNPAFVSGADFHLQSGSPAINAGITVGLTTDYDGITVGNPPDIGAFEY
jgi:hypothetical protein